jgi:hypothetical protein
MRRIKRQEKSKNAQGHVEEHYCVGFG